jgi:hypothetical protein
MAPKFPLRRLLFPVVPLSSPSSGTSQFRIRVTMVRTYYRYYWRDINSLRAVSYSSFAWVRPHLELVSSEYRLPWRALTIAGVEGTNTLHWRLHAIIEQRIRAM